MWGIPNGDSWNVRYNLNELNGHIWSVQDNRADTGSNEFTYAFSVCSDIKMQDSNWIQQNCAATYNPDGSTTDTPAMAFQIVNQNSTFTPPKQDRCHRLSGSASDLNDVTLTQSLYDPDNVAAGVSFKYTGGDGCYEHDGVKRSLTVHYICHEGNDNTPDNRERVDETSPCAYELFVNTIYGCPIECSTTSVEVEGVTYQKLCGGHGVCAEGPGGVAQCICNEGYEGAACTPVATPEPASEGGIIAALVIMIIVLIAAAIGLYVLWGKVKSLRLDMSAYRSLAGDDAHAPDEGSLMMS